MSDFIGAIEVPEASNVGTYPLAPDYGSGEAIAPEVSVFTFGSGEEKREQRFYLGNGVRRFTLQHSSVTLDELQALRDLFDDAKGGEGEFTYNAPNQDGTTTAYTCRFENAPLAWEHEATPSARVSVNLIGVPTSAPTYTLNATDTRFPSGTLETALLAQAQQLVPLIKITPREPGYDVIYLSDRRVTVGSQLYQARLLDWSGISQALDGEADQASFRFGNADRVMRDLSHDTDLWKAKIEFSVFHVGTGIKLDFWTGIVQTWTGGEQIDFTMQAVDNLYELRETYPTRFITRTCGKDLDDGVECPYTAEGSGGDPDFCDKSFEGADGCQAHGMDPYFGGIATKPQTLFNIKDSGKGASGRRISPVSLVSDSIQGEPLQEVYTDSDMPVNCQLAAGREEGAFYTALGIVGAGPIGAFGSDDSKHLLDGQPMHPGFSPRFGAGNDPTGSDYFCLDPDDGTRAAGVAFAQIRRSDPAGIQLSKITEHVMQVVVSGGLGGWYWTDPTTRAWSNTITNPIWIALNVFLRAKRIFSASAGAQEALVDTASAIAAAAICNDVVDTVYGGGTETQFRFRGVIADAKPLKDWLTEILKNCLGYYTNANGKLKFGIRVNSSAVEAFEPGNVILGSIQLAPIQPHFNDVKVEFADNEYDFQPNTVRIYDQDHVNRYGRVGNGSTINLCGTFTKSQAARIATTILREEIGGITQAEWSAARRVALKTTALALAVEPGMVCSLTHADMPGGYGEFRVTRWSLNSDWSVDIEGSPTADSMYDLAIGPKPADVAASAPPTPRYLDRVPADVQPIGSDAFLIDDQIEDGITVIHEISYSPPGTDSSDIGVFNGVFAWIEAPDGSGKVYPSGSWDYDGDPDGVGAARYGHIQLKTPQPVGGATWRILLVSKSPFITNKLVLSGSGETPSMTSVIGAQDTGGAVPQLVADTDFTATLGIIAANQAGQEFQQVITTITSPPVGAPADAFAGLWAFYGDDPTADEPFVGDGGSHWFSAKGLTDAHEVWFPLGAAAEDVYLFPTINTKNSQRPPDATYLFRTLTIPANSGVPSVAAPGAVTIGSPTKLYYADPNTKQKLVQITVPYTAPDTPDFYGFSGVVTFILYPDPFSGTPLSLAANTIERPQGIHGFTDGPLDPGQCVFVLPAPRRQELWRFSLFSKNASVTSASFDSVDITVDPSPDTNVDNFATGAPVPVVGARGYMVPYSFDLPAAAAWSDLDWSRVEIRVKTASMGAGDTSVVAAVIDRGISGALLPGDFESQMTFADLPDADQLWEFFAFSYDLAGNRYDTGWGYDTETMPGIKTIGQATSFSMAVTDTNPGLKRGKFTATWTPPNTIQWFSTKFYRRPCNSSFVATGEYVPVFEVLNPSAPSAHGSAITADQDGDGWLFPTANEYWQFEARSVSIAGIENKTSAPTYNLTVGPNGGLDMSKVNTTTWNTSEFEVSSGAMRMKELTVDKIVAGTSLKVGGGGGKAGQVGVFDGSNTLIGWIGTQSGYYGGWFKQLYVGGTNPSDAKIVATGGGVTMADVTLNVTSGSNTAGVNSSAQLYASSGSATAYLSAGGVALVSGSANALMDAQSLLLAHSTGATASYLGFAGLQLYNSSATQFLNLTASVCNLMNSIPLQMNGTTAIDSSRNTNFNNMKYTGQFWAPSTADSTAFSSLTSVAKIAHYNTIGSFIGWIMVSP